VVIEEDDNKRRRNLTTYSLFIWSSWFLDINLKGLTSLICTNCASPIEPWRYAALTIAVLVYLVWRYVVREIDPPRAGAPYHGWKDWRDAAPAADIEYHKIINKAFFKEVLRLWKNSQSITTKPRLVESVEFLSNLRESFANQQGNPKIQAQIQNASVRNLTKAQDWLSLEPTYGTGEFEFEFTTQQHAKDQLLFQDIRIKIPAWRDRIWRIRARLRVHLTTNLAVDVWIPYYLAMAAAYAIVERYISAA